MENVVEILSIDEQKIIHILLKHLMLLKNENEYVKNNAGLNSSGNGVFNSSKGINWSGNEHPTISEGINWSGEEVSNIRDGINWSGNEVSNIKDGINWSGNEVSSIRDGINRSSNDISSISLGMKWAFEALVAIDAGANAESIVYACFEKGLIAALEQYVKTGGSKISIYSYYTDFMEAIIIKKTATSTLKPSVFNLWFTNTHILPEKITPDFDARTKLKLALHDYLPRSASRASYDNIVMELLYLHNYGKATGTQLREATGLTVSGFSKHSPKLQRSGLIKKQPPSNYVLTETSKNILLEIFGVSKNEAKS